MVEQLELQYMKIPIITMIALTIHFYISLFPLFAAKHKHSSRIHIVGERERARYVLMIRDWKTCFAW